MEWIKAIGEVTKYIEDNINEDFNISIIANKLGISPLYLQKGFTFLCGISVSEYIRKRRLSLAGEEVVSTDKKIIDIALKYGYESPDSFTKAFTRFHGVTPLAVRKNNVGVKSFLPLKIKLVLEGGNVMEYKIVKKDEFKVLGVSKEFNYSDGMEKVPQFWKEHFSSGKGKYVCGMYGISIDEKMGGDKFEYLIADEYKDKKEVPSGFVIKTIPEFTWAVFPCTGSMPESFATLNKKIFDEWLPSCNEYKVAAGYYIEMYSDPNEFAKGIEDENYYAEVWLPVIKIDK